MSEIERSTTPSVLRGRRVSTFVRIVAGLTLVGGFGLIGGSSGAYKVCEDQLAQTGDQSVAHICRQPTVTDLPVIAGAVLLMALLWPDIAEVSFGVVSLKRRLAKTQEAIEGTERTIAKQAEMVIALQAQILSLGVTQSTVAEGHASAAATVEQMVSTTNQTVVNLIAALAPADRISLRDEDIDRDSQLSFSPSDKLYEIPSLTSAFSRGDHAEVERIFLAEWTRLESVSEFARDYELSLAADSFLSSTAVGQLDLALKAAFSKVATQRLEHTSEPLVLLGTTIPHAKREVAFELVSSGLSEYARTVAAASSARNRIVRSDADEFSLSTLRHLAVSTAVVNKELRSRLEALMSVD